MFSTMYARLFILVAVLVTALGFAPAPKSARGLMRLQVALHRPVTDKRVPDVWKGIDATTNLVPTILIAMASTVEPSLLMLLSPEKANRINKSFWAQQDIADTLAASFGVPTSEELNRRKVFYEKIDIIDEVELFESLDEYMDRRVVPLAMSVAPVVQEEENFIGAAAAAAFKPFDHKMDMEKVSNAPMFFKPVPLSKMKAMRGPHNNHVLHL